MPKSSKERRSLVVAADAAVAHATEPEINPPEGTTDYYRGNREHLKEAYGQLKELLGAAEEKYPGYVADYGIHGSALSREDPNDLDIVIHINDSGDSLHDHPFMLELAELQTSMGMQQHREPGALQYPLDITIIAGEGREEYTLFGRNTTRYPDGTEDVSIGLVENIPRGEFQTQKDFWPFDDTGRCEESTDDHYLLMISPKDSGLPIGSFDPGKERELVLEVLEHTREVLRNEEPFVRACGEEEGAMLRHRDDKIGMNIVFVADRANAGRGSGGLRSAKVFYRPYSTDSKQVADFSPSFWIDGVYTMTHEFHHAFGSHSELDNFSDVVALDFHLAKGNSLAPKAIRFELENRILLALNTKGTKPGREARRQLKWLYRRHPEEVLKAVNDYDPEYGVLFRQRVKRWQET